MKYLFLIAFLIIFAIVVIFINIKEQPISVAYSPLFKDQLLELHNAQRRTNLEMHITLDEAAQLHADWMASTNTLSHTGENRSTVANRLKKNWTIIGENIAYGQKTPKEVTKDWINSPGHYRNIINPKFKLVGFGITQDKKGRFYWCAVFSD